MELFNNEFCNNVPNDEAYFIRYVFKYFKQYKNGCNDETLDTYIKRYNRDIFPIINPLVKINELDEKTIRKYLEIIKINKCIIDASLDKNYAHLFTDAVDYYYLTNNIEKNNPLWGSAFGFYGSIKSKNSKEVFGSIPKSFSIENNIKVFRYLFSSHSTPTGENIGLAIMLFIPCRENEIAALKFKNIKQIENYPFAHYLEIGDNSTKINSREIKPGSKTWNGPRVIPLPNFLYEFLMQRKQFVKETSGLEDIDNLPIACKKDQYQMNCSTNEISTAGKNMMRNIVKINKEDFSALSALLLEQADTEFDIQEKDPTAYLLRRNAGTFAQCLGLSQTEIQYIMGHDMMFAPLDRKFYGSSEFIFEIWKKLQYHPLNNIDKDRTSSLKNYGEYFNVKQIKNVNILSSTINSNNLVSIKIKTREQYDPVKIEIDGQDKCTITEYFGVVDYDETINITKQLIDVYRSICGKFRAVIEKGNLEKLTLNQTKLKEENNVICSKS